MKLCECCKKEYDFIPDDAKETSYGYMWNCECGSTLVEPSELEKFVKEFPLGIDPEEV